MRGAFAGMRGAFGRREPFPDTINEEPDSAFLTEFALQGGSFPDDRGPKPCLTCVISKRGTCREAKAPQHCIYIACKKQLKDLRTHMRPSEPMTWHQAMAAAYGQWRRENPADAEAYDTRPQQGSSSITGEAAGQAPSKGAHPWL